MRSIRPRSDFCQQDTDHFAPLVFPLSGGSGPGQDGERRGDPGRETPRQERLHEEVQARSQPGRGGLDHRQGERHHQAQGWYIRPVFVPAAVNTTGPVVILILLSHLRRAEVTARSMNKLQLFWLAKLYFNQLKLSKESEKIAVLILISSVTAIAIEVSMLFS